jgi:hypothetical protein
MHQGCAEWVGYAMQRVPEGGEMNDRELLDLAAKAAGVVWIDEAFDYDNFGRMMLDFGQGTQEWNPLADSNDAFRLAVKLWIDVSFPPYREPDPPVVHAGMYWDVSDSLWYRYEELRGADPYAATRRAIVRAAAEIGRGMK